MPGSRHRFRDVQALRMALRGRSNNRIYIGIIIFLAAMVAVLAWLSATAPTPSSMPV